METAAAPAVRVAPWPERAAVAVAAMLVVASAVDAPFRLALARGEGLRALELSVGDVHVRLRTTAYFELEAAAPRWAAEHPLFGVGAGSFDVGCPVMAVDTVGYRGPHRAHDELTGLVVERGLLGVAVAVSLVLVLIRRCTVVA